MSLSSFLTPAAGVYLGLWRAGAKEENDRYKIARNHVTRSGRPTRSARQPRFSMRGEIELFCFLSIFFAVRDLA